MPGWPYTTAAWRRLRAAKLAAEPLCEVCKLRGRTVLARAVDHRVAIAAGGPAFPTLDGLMAMCIECHNTKTSRKDIGSRTAKLGSPYKGCAVDGSPISPDDDWYA